jgi:hypothetical protein
MNAQIFILLIAGVAIIRFVKGIFSKNKQQDIKEEINGFFLQSITTVVLFLVIYGVLNIIG